MAGCAVPTGAGTVLQAMPANPHGGICILGAGGVGLAAVCGAMVAGWPLIAVADVRPARLARARELGVTHTIQVGEEDLEEAARRITDGHGFDLVVECAGSVPSMESALRLAKPRGGKVVIVGNLETGKTFAVNPFDLIAGRSLWGSWGGGINPDHDIPQLVQMMAQGMVNHRLLMGRRFPLEQVNEALAALDDDEPGRPVITWS